MDETAGASTLPVDLEGSLDPGQLPGIEVSYQASLRDDTNMAAMTSFDQGSPQVVSKSYSGRLSPVRGRSIKEYDKQISDLKKENFSLKIRIFHMEQRMEQRYGDGQDVYKLNVELQVQVEKLKKDLADKQDLIERADAAMDTLRANCMQEEEGIRNRILSEFTEKIKNLQAHLEDTRQECERYRKDSFDAGEKVKALQQSLNSINADLCKSNREKDGLADKLKTAEFDVQHLTAQLKLTEQSKSEKEKENLAISQQVKDLNDQLQQSQKEISRNKRDLENISTLLADHSHIDSTSILEPVHQQDEMEDALETIKRKDNRLDMLEGALKQKEDMVGKLEDALKELEKKIKDVEAEKNKTDVEMERLRKYDAKINKSLQLTLKTLDDKDKELKMTTEKLNAAAENIKSLQEALKEAELEKAKTLGDLTKEIGDLEVDNRRLKLQLTEAEGTAENLAMSLGKKEGELAGFQDQLKRAMDALRCSDDAVEALHNQLKAERAEFDKKLKEEAMKYEANPNNSTGAYTEKEQLSDSEKMALKHSQKVAALAEELEALKAELQGKDMKIQALENSRTWYESHKTVHHFTERTAEAELPLELLTDLKNLLQQLQREMASLSKLHTLLSQLNNAG
ncbi:CDK5 regulatory subunit associated protein 2 [Elysia marginata]|uniref:CDK5 regulatory subunit associated protein 2 n=1 Tax=Elysia marginata TaxID=1093978 RepID=A0AAV4HK25_9GAST|nr:CDK5 regulatory subunit associated protein 2 [Elysia marginata]